MRTAGIVTALLALAVCAYWTYDYLRRRAQR
jgi:hypothetical protein